MQKREIRIIEMQNNEIDRIIEMQKEIELSRCKKKSNRIFNRPLTWGQTGIEPVTSRTQSENHTTRPCEESYLSLAI